MEKLIIFLTVLFVLSVILFTEFFLHRKPVSAKEVADYQKTLDEIDRTSKAKYGVEFKFDAKTQFAEERKQTKASVLIFSGLFLALAFVVLVFAINMTPAVIGVMCASAIMLICYGMIKMAESKKVAVVVLTAIFIIGSLLKFAFDSLLAMSPTVYLYLCGLIAILAIFSFMPKFKRA